MEDYPHASLREQLRDALVAYYLGQLVPANNHLAPGTIATAEDLYQYLLIDNQVCAEVDTSRVAQGIASVQQHVHAIYNGMEPGFAQAGDSQQGGKNVQLWHECMSQYSIWAGYQMLADYPENYLEPALRLRKTEAFKTFESELAQARLTPDNLQKALGAYLVRFEEVSNLSAVCCYIDGLNFRRADYYFIGRSVVDTSKYFWRKAALDVDDSSTHVPASAWNEWRPIEVPTSGTTTHVRAAVVQGRLHLVWLEQLRPALDAEDKPLADRFVYRLNVAYLQSNGRWSAAITLRESAMPSFETLERENYVLVAISDERLAASHRLVVSFQQRGAIVVAAPGFLLIRDEHWQPVTLTVTAQMWLQLELGFQVVSGTGGVQHTLEGADANGDVWTLESVVWNQAGDNHIAQLNRYIELDANIRTIDGVCQIETTGACNTLWYASDSDTAVPFRGNFGIWQNLSRSPYGMVLNGLARTPAQLNPWGATASDTVYPIRFGMERTASSLGYNQFDITRKKRTGDIPTFVGTDQGGLFLDLTTLQLPHLRYVRLNTTFAAELVRKAERSLEGVLGWETQHTAECPLPGAPPGETLPVDFNGANGLYFWELFFHVPHLAARRLHQSFDYAGAEQWLHCLFNPQVRVAPLFPAPEHVHWLPYWTSRPLAFADDPLQDVVGPRDPHVIATGAPSHYRKAIFTLYLDNLIAWGDSLYREVTRDALTEAKLLYVRALSLLGPLSKGRSISQWQPRTLADAAGSDGELFAGFEASAPSWFAADTPRAASADTWSPLLDAPWFRLPVNTRLLDLWSDLDLRLFNLRNNLSLDGRALQLALYEAPANPLDLLRAQQAGSATVSRQLGGQQVIPAYRFKAMLPRARLAVETLTRFGDQVRQCMESRDRAGQEALGQQHIVELSAFVERIDALSIEQSRLRIQMLEASREQLRAQIQTYDMWLARDVSDAEQRAESMFADASILRIVAGASRAVGHGLSTAPNTITFTPGPIPIPIPGGYTWGGPPWAAASVLETAGIALFDSAEARLRTDARNRRRAEWNFLRDQSQRQIDSLEPQIEGQALSVRAAELKRERSVKLREQAQTLYAFMLNRATNAELYQWLLGQVSTLYFQAYDAVLSLCLATEACWQYEIGDRETTFIPLDTWVDNRHGLTAGESLGLGLLQMESAFLMRHERRLELVKTVSLRGLLQDFENDTAEKGWASVIDSLSGTGAIEFQLPPSLYDRDYPGHYLRQLVQISVSLPAALGPYENVRMVLGQRSSSYLLKPDWGGTRYLYHQAGELPEDEDDVDPRFVVANQRPGQHVVISADLEDNGMSSSQDGDERYRPFEGTGAVSSWTLTFPRHTSARQQDVIRALQDIIIHVRYAAVDGGKAFADQVRELLPPASESLQEHKPVRSRRLA